MESRVPRPDRHARRDELAGRLSVGRCTPQPCPIRLGPSGTAAGRLDHGNIKLRRDRCPVGCRGFGSRHGQATRARSRVQSAGCRPILAHVPGGRPPLRRHETPITDHHCGRRYGHLPSDHQQCTRPGLPAAGGSSDSPGQNRSTCHDRDDSDRLCRRRPAGQDSQLRQAVLSESRNGVGGPGRLGKRGAAPLRGGEHPGRFVLRMPRRRLERRHGRHLRGGPGGQHRSVA